MYKNEYVRRWAELREVLHLVKHGYVIAFTAILEKQMENLTSFGWHHWT